MPKQSTIGEDGSLADAAKRRRRQATSSNHCAGTRIALMVERLAYDCAAKEHVAVVSNNEGESTDAPSTIDGTSGMIN